MHVEEKKKWRMQFQKFQNIQNKFIYGSQLANSLHSINGIFVNRSKNREKTSRRKSKLGHR